MNTFGTVFFKQVNNNQLALFQPLQPNVVQENLHDRAALREFKQRYSKLNVVRSNTMSMNEMVIDVPDRILAVIAKYSEGLKQIILKYHPWHALARRKVTPESINKGKELLEYLELAPTAKNAKKVLEMIKYYKKYIVFYTCLYFSPSAPFWEERGGERYIQSLECISRQKFTFL